MSVANMTLQSCDAMTETHGQSPIPPDSERQPREKNQTALPSLRPTDCETYHACPRYPRSLSLLLSSHQLISPPSPVRRGAWPPTQEQTFPSRCHLSLLSVDFRHRGWAFKAGGTLSSSPLFLALKGTTESLKQSPSPPPGPCLGNKEPGIIHSFWPSAPLISPRRAVLGVRRKSPLCK